MFFNVNSNFYHQQLKKHQEAFLLIPFVFLNNSVSMTRFQIWAKSILSLTLLAAVAMAKDTAFGNDNIDLKTDKTTTTKLSDSQEISTFDKYLPISYRALFLINLGIWLWYVNLKVCFKHNIEVSKVLKFPPNVSDDVSSPQLIKKTKQLLVKTTAATLMNYFFFYIHITNGIDWFLLHYFPLIGILSIFFFMLFPVNTPDKRRFVATIKRIIVGNIDINLRNNDILLADTFTSYNRVLIDFMVYISALLIGLPTLPTSSSVLKRDHTTIYSFDLLIGLFPSIIRFKQCLFEFEKSGRRNNQHFLNAVKYSTAALPVLATIVIRQGYPSFGISCWYIGSFINSTYSLIWDIQMDWNFEVFHKILKSDEGKDVLRKVLLFDVRSYYYAAIFIDFCLRYVWVCRWLFKSGDSNSLLLYTLGALYSSEIGHFTLEILEILRRWVWVFIKIETEFVKMSSFPNSPALSTNIALDNLA